MDESKTPPPAEEPIATLDEIHDGRRIREGIMPDGINFRSEFVLNPEAV